MAGNMKTPHSLQTSKTWDFHDEVAYTSEFIAWLSPQVVRQISEANQEPEWMLTLRLNALEIYKKKAFPTWWPELCKLDLESIYYFAKPQGAGNHRSREDVPENIKSTFDRLGIPQAEKEMLAGVGAQYDSETVYHSLKEEFSNAWVIFDDLSHALRVPEYEAIIRKYFAKCISPAYHKFSALHYAVWSGGTFLYVPKDVKLPQAVQSYFRMNVKKGGQFEHTLIILEEGSHAHYIEWCSAPKYDESSLHAGGVEVFVGENAHLRYSSVENWSMDTYNLNTKKAIVQKNGCIEWVGGNLGSSTTMLYPCSMLVGDSAKAEHLWVSFAGAGQTQDIGAKVIHIGKNTTSNIVSKSLSKWGGISTYRGLVDILPSATGSVCKVDCDALILDDLSESHTIPDIKVANATSTVAHEATAGKISETDLFYLESRGLSESQATALLVNGFISPILKELPLEYASEMNILIDMEFEWWF